MTENISDAQILPPKANHWLTTTTKKVLRPVLSLFKFVCRLPALLRWWAYRTFTPSLATLQAYRYSPLRSPRDIRILVLHGGLPGEDIRCSLRTVSLDNAIRYEALSYTWGDPSETRRLQCGGASLDLTVNLHSALQHLRHVYSERVLWADAICINQNDLIERGSQVQLMAEVYSSASRVVLWLGEDMVGVSEAFEALRWTRSLFPEGPPSVTLFSMSQAQVQATVNNFSDMFRTERGLEIQRMWLSTSNLVQRQWFTRKWVVQEIIKADTGLLMCGSLTLPWSILQDTIAYLKYFRLFPCFIGWGVDLLPESLDHISLIEVMRNAEIYIRLDEILYSTRRFVVTMSRDHVISILGLASDINVDDLHLLANYVASTTEYFKMFMRWSIDKYGSLLCLSCGFDPANINNPNLPSWMPDFRSWDRQPGMPRSLCNFQATLDSSPIVLFSSEVAHLQIAGTIIDQIDSLGAVPVDDLDLVPEPSTSDGYQDSITNIQRRLQRDRDWLLECKSVATADSNSPESPGFPSFCRTLVWNANAIRHLSSEQLSDRFVKWMYGVENYSLGDPSEPPDLMVISFIGTFSVGRRFARTVQGRLGSMPRFSAVGDKICLFYGGTLPYVIRPRGDGTYTFLGDCYLDGVMYGAAMVDGRKTEEFTLV